MSQKKYQIDEHDLCPFSAFRFSPTIGAGDTLADAIRNAGIRCETCEHYSVLDRWNGECGEVADPNEMTVFYRFFCAHHSALNEDEK